MDEREERRKRKTETESEIELQRQIELKAMHMFPKAILPVQSITQKDDFYNSPQHLVAVAAHKDLIVLTRPKHSAHSNDRVSSFSAACTM